MKEHNLPTRKSNSRALLFLGVAMAHVACQGTGREGAGGEARRTVSVAAAADLKFALDDLVGSFEAAHPEIGVEVTYGSSGNFFAQLSNRAPFDLFLSADVEYPRRLVEDGLADPRSEFLYAVGQIVLWVPRSSPIDVEALREKALLDPAVRKIAIANPRHAPYGRAAEAALDSLGVLAAVRDRLVLGENVAHTAQFVESGAAEIGVIALSLALAPPLQEEGRYWVLPLETYPRMEQGGVLLNWAKDRQAAMALRAFVVSAEGRSTLRRYGFIIPGD
jgi:molybdate transport system substrate-binding protein